METMLTSLYALQQVDLQLEEIADLKGELPGLVANLEAQVEDVTTKLKNLNEQITNLKIARDNADVEILASTEKIEKYKTQQLEVKSNKQYDALAKEIDSATEGIANYEKEMQSFEGKMTTATSDVAALNARLSELTAELQEKSGELDEVNKEHEKEESKLLLERKRIVADVPKGDLERYERIRKAKGGKAIVPVKRNSCGGCFNLIPPQKILELRQNNRMYMCEHCGRMVVSDEIVSRSMSLL